MQGLLKKEGGNIRSWKQRWFVLDEDVKTLAYYKSDSDFKSGKAPKGILNLYGAKADLSQKKPPKESTVKIFQVLAPSSSTGKDKFKDRMYYFLASSDEETNKWIDAINTVAGTAGPTDRATYVEQQQAQAQPSRNTPSSPEDASEPSEAPATATTAPIAVPHASESHPQVTATPTSTPADSSSLSATPKVTATPASTPSTPVTPVAPSANFASTWLVLAGTGNVGKYVVQNIIKRHKDVCVRVVTRNPEKPLDPALVAGALPGQVVYIRADVAEFSSLKQAVSGVDKIFFNVPLIPSLVSHTQAWVDAIKSSGSSVKHIVKLSLEGMEDAPNWIFSQWHAKAEALLQSLPIPWTLLRANSFFQNFANMFGETIREQGVIECPAEECRVSFIDCRDVAELAVEIMSRSDMNNRIISANGNEPMTHQRIAEIISKVTGKQVVFKNIPFDAYSAKLKQLGLPDIMSQAMVQLYDFVYLDGVLALGLQDERTLLGRELISFEQHVKDFLHDYKAGVAPPSRIDIPRADLEPSFRFEPVTTSTHTEAEQPTKPIAVIIGGTGNVGQHLVRRLVQKYSSQYHVRVATRNPAARPDRFMRGAELCAFDASNPSSWDPLFQGAVLVFLNLPVSPVMDKVGEDIVNALKKAGTVQFVVKLSAVGVDTYPQLQLSKWHQHIESALASSGIPHCILKPNFFMQNIITSFGTGITHFSAIKAPMGEGRASMIDVQDIGELAAEVLVRKDRFAGRSFNLSGPEAVSMHEVASMLSSVLDKHVGFYDCTGTEFSMTLQTYGVPEILANSFSELFDQTFRNNGLGLDTMTAPRNDTTVSLPLFMELLGREPQNFYQFAKENVLAFKPRRRVVLVTGASGQIGRHLVQELIKYNTAQRTAKLSDKAVVIRVATRGGNPVIQHLKWLGADEVVQVQDNDSASTTNALNGVDTVLMCHPFSPMMPEQASVLTNAIKANGKVKHVVRISAMGPDEDPSMILSQWHIAADEAVKSLGSETTWTLIRPNSFMQNIGTFFGGSIKSSGAFYGPFGESSVSFVHAADIAAVTAKAILFPAQFAGKTLTLTGPAALAHAQIADIIGSKSGQETKFVDIDDGTYRSAMAGFGVPDMMTDCLVDLYNKQYKAGHGSKVTSTVLEVTGRAPKTFEQYVEENIHLFAAKAPHQIIVLASVEQKSNLVECVSQALIGAESAGAAVRVVFSQIPPASVSKALQAIGATIAVFDRTNASSVDAAVASATALVILPSWTMSSISDASAALSAVRRANPAAFVVQVAYESSARKCHVFAIIQEDLGSLIRSSSAYATVKIPALLASDFFPVNGVISHYMNADSALALVDPRDVALAVSRCILSYSVADNAGKTFVVAPSQTTSPSALATHLGQALGFSVVYSQLSPTEMVNSLVASGFQEMAARDYLTMCNMLKRAFQPVAPSSGSYVVEDTAFAYAASL